MYHPVHENGAATGAFTGSAFTARSAPNAAGAASANASGAPVSSRPQLLRIIAVSIDESGLPFVDMIARLRNAVCYRCATASNIVVPAGRDGCKTRN